MLVPWSILVTWSASIPIIIYGSVVVPLINVVVLVVIVVPVVIVLVRVSI